jgi:hypothetical protein
LSKLEQKIQEMAQLTVLSRRISEIQEKNMKKYPFVFFNALTEAKIEYDLDRIKTANDEAEISNSLVSYYLTLDESQNPNIEVRYKMLEVAIRTLFWSDVTVEIYINDRIVFKSKKNARQQSTSK